MVCVYCAEKTQVVNSRPQKRLNQVWRRRQCLQCGAVFTTEEAFNPSGSLVFDDQRTAPVPFSRDKLFASLLSALSHRTDAVESASAITATVLAKCVQDASDGRIVRQSLLTIAHTTLVHYDTTAATVYAAYHQ